MHGAMAAVQSHAALQRHHSFNCDITRLAK